MIRHRAARSTAPVWLRAFRCTDDFVMQALKDSARLDGPLAQTLACELRSVLVRGGAALVAASAEPPEGEMQAELSRARRRLAEASYHLNLARRFGWVSLQRYRGLVARQQAAIRELDTLIVERPAAGGGARSRDPG